jgi:hypothetical protein
LRYATEMPRPGAVLGTIALDRGGAVPLQRQLYAALQFPLGMTMSLSRRLRLLAWAAAAGAWVLEDDFDSEYRYAGRPGDRGTAHVHPFGDLSDRACTPAQALQDPPSRRISQRIQDPLSVSCHLSRP